MTRVLDARLATAMRAAFDRGPVGIVRAPGRVNLIGEHTDYNDGFVLPCAIPGETRIGWAPRGDRRVRVVADDMAGETDAFALDAPIDRQGDGGWRDYVRGMIVTMRGAGHVLDGADLAIAGDLPRGSGLSSSASLEVAVGHAMLARRGERIDPTAMALLAQRAENDFVGMKCGVMDQLASAASVAGAALLIDCRSLETRPVPIPDGAVIAIIHSGVVRGLVDGHYNRRRLECEQAAAAIGVPALRDATLEMLAAADMPDIVRARGRHIITENARTLAAADALAAGDLVTMGTLMAASHASMRDDFEITVRAIDELAEIAQAAIGREGGARMTGGGFGGAVVAMLRSGEVDRVVADIRTRYRTPAGDPPLVTIERAAAGAGPV